MQCTAQCRQTFLCDGLQFLILQSLCRYLTWSATFAFRWQRRDRLVALPFRPLQVRIQMLLQLVLSSEHSWTDTASEGSFTRMHSSMPRQMRRSSESQGTKVAGEGFVLRPIGLDERPCLFSLISSCSLHDLEFPLYSGLGRFVRAF